MSSFGRDSTRQTRVQPLVQNEAASPLGGGPASPLGGGFSARLGGPMSRAPRRKIVSEPTQLRTVIYHNSITFYFALNYHF
jgi:hypothetical protein